MMYDEFGNPIPNENRQVRISKREILNILQQQMGANEMDLVDSASDEYARHVCLGGNKVYLLPRRVIPFNTPEGVINITLYRCEVCGKIIVDRNFI